MRWTNMSEKDMLKAWAKEVHAEKSVEESAGNSNKYNSRINECVTNDNLGSTCVTNESADSYWGAYDNANNIMEYDYQNVPEMTALLKRELSEDCYKDLIIPLVVAANKERMKQESKMKAQENTDTPDAGAKDEFAVPEFVYVF